MAISQVAPPSASHDPTHRGGVTQPVGGRATAVQPGAVPGAPGTERRRFRRVPSSGLLVAIDGTEYPVLDLSVGGFRVRPYGGGLVSGDRFALRFRVMITGRVAEFRGEGRVLRRDGDDLIAVYATRNPKFYQGLARYISQEAALRLSYHGSARATDVADPAIVETSA